MKLKLLLLMLVVAATSYADNESCLIIKQKSGNETIFEFSTNPIITFEGEEMVVTNDFTTIYVPLDDIAEYLVNNDASGIKDVSIVPQFTSGHVVFSGLSKDTPVYVYTLDGKVISGSQRDRLTEGQECCEIRVGYDGGLAREIAAQIYAHCSNRENNE